MDELLSFMQAMAGFGKAPWEARVIFWIDVFVIGPIVLLMCLAVLTRKADEFTRKDKL
jgi:hypothetical protein